MVLRKSWELDQSYNIPNSRPSAVQYKFCAKKKQNSALKIRNSVLRKCKFCIKNCSINKPPRILHSENANSALQNLNSALSKCKFCTQKLQWCPISRSARILHSEKRNSALKKWKPHAQMEILWSEYAYFHNAMKSLAFLWFFSPNHVIPRCHAQVKIPR